MVDFNNILREGKIIDNKRVKSLNMKEALKSIAQDSESFKCAVGYFYLESLVEIISSLKDLKEIRKLYPRAYRSWNEEDDMDLEKLFNSGLKVSEISKKLERRPGAIGSRLKKLELIE